jgi:hypothetical protein
MKKDRNTRKADMMGRVVTELAKSLSEELSDPHEGWDGALWDADFWVRTVIVRDGQLVLQGDCGDNAQPRELVLAPVAWQKDQS